MTIGRRAFVVASGMGLGHWALGFASAQDASVDALFTRSIVVDALSADEEWNKPEPILEAYTRSGVTAIHTSLANRNENNRIGRVRSRVADLVVAALSEN